MLPQGSLFKLMSSHELMEDYNYTSTQNNKVFNLVSGCIHQNISVSQCGLTSKNLLITVARNNYDFSPLA